MVQRDRASEADLRAEIAALQHCLRQRSSQGSPATEAGAPAGPSPAPPPAPATGTGTGTAAIEPPEEAHVPSLPLAEPDGPTEEELTEISSEEMMDLDGQPVAGAADKRSPKKGGPPPGQPASAAPSPGPTPSAARPTASAGPTSSTARPAASSARPTQASRPTAATRHDKDQPTTSSRPSRRGPRAPQIPPPIRPVALTPGECWSYLLDRAIARHRWAFIALAHKWAKYGMPSRLDTKKPSGLTIQGQRWGWREVRSSW